MTESPVTGSRRGYAVIITNENAVECSKFKTRKGADQDDQNTQRAFCTKLNFEWLNEDLASKDLPRSALFHDSPHVNPCACISCRIQATDHSQSECFFLSISSHGSEVKGKQLIYFSDGKHASITELVDMLSDERCPSLRGKPRILIIQACRSDRNVPEEQCEDHGFDVDVTSDDTPDGAMATLNVKAEDIIADDVDDADPLGQSETNANNAVNDTNMSLQQDLDVNERASDQPERTDRHNERNLTCLQNTNTSSDAKAEGLDVVEDIPPGEENDPYIEDDDSVYSECWNIPEEYLIVYPTVSGKKAKRNQSSGSWLIKELCDVIDDHNFCMNPEMNFLKILTRTTHRVGNINTTVYTKDEKGKSTNQLDKTKSDLKNAVCIMHKLTKPLVFRAVETTAKTSIGPPAL